MAISSFFLFSFSPSSLSLSPSSLSLSLSLLSLLLDFVNEFAEKHKLKWGADNVMQVSNTAYKPMKWNLGNQEIDSCDTYKYLGDIIMRNGSNKKNFEEREAKVMASTRKILSLCGNAVFRSIRLQALLKMHNCCTMAGFHDVKAL